MRVALPATVDQVDGAMVSCVTSDLSAGGARLVTDHGARLSSETLVVVDAEDHLLVARATVVGTTIDLTTGKTAIRVRFDGSPGGQRRAEQFVRHLR
ncbi:MAG: hypothetical protein NVS3B21_14730 [Acidimicrobiales bacterium]